MEKLTWIQQVVAIALFWQAAYFLCASDTFVKAYRLPWLLGLITPVAIFALLLLGGFFKF
jgi:hypothetical protein